jgi:hypothetical protein
MLGALIVLLFPPALCLAGYALGHVLIGSILGALAWLTCSAVALGYAFAFVGDGSIPARWGVASVAFAALLGVQSIAMFALWLGHADVRVTNRRELALMPDDGPSGRLREETRSPVGEGQQLDFWESFYFSACAWTTGSYGEYSPASKACRVLVALEAFIGATYLGVLGGLVASLLQRRRESSG